MPQFLEASPFKGLLLRPVPILNTLISDLGNMFKADTDRIFKTEVTKTIIKKLKLKLPDEFLKKWILSSNKEATREQIDSDYEKYADGLKWQLIENSIIKDQNIKVEDLISKRDKGLVEILKIKKENKF